MLVSAVLPIMTLYRLPHGQKQKLERCKKTCVARVIIEDTEHNNEKLTVSMFNEVIKKLTLGEDFEAGAAHGVSRSLAQHVRKNGYDDGASLAVRGTHRQRPALEEDELDTETKLLCLDAKQFEVNSQNVVVRVENIPSVV